MATEETRVNVVDDLTGEVSSVPSSQLALAADEGLRPETDKEATVRKNVEEYETPLGQAQLFGEGLLGEATLGVSDVGIEAARSPEQREAFAKAIERNPVAYYGGRATGFAGSLLYGGPVVSPVFKGATRAGRAVGAAVATTVGNEFASLLAKKVVESSARMATEGLVLTAPKAAMELAFSEHPEHAAETIMSGAVFGGLLGATIPIGATAYDKAHGALYGRLKEIFSKGKNAAKGLEGEAATEAAAAGAAGPPRATDLAEGSVMNLIKEELEMRPENYADIMAARERLGIGELPAGITSGSPIIKNAESMIGQNPSIAGAKIRSEYKNLNDALVTSMEKNVFGEVGGPSMTKAQLGRKAREEIVNELEKRSEYFAKEYDAINSKTKNIFVDEGARLEAAERLKNAQNILENRGESWAEQSVREAEKLLRKESVEGLQMQRSTIANEIQKAIRTGDGNAAAALGKVKSEIDALIEKSIQSSGEAALYKDWQKLQGEYSQFKEYMKQFGDVARLGNSSTRRAIIMKLHERDPEQLVGSVFNLNRSEKLQFVKDNLPESFKDFQRYKLAQLREEGLMNDGTLRAGRFAEEALALPEDALATFYTPKQLETLKDVYVLSKQVPRQFPNSNTAVAQEFQQLFSVAGLVNNARDALIYSVLKGTKRVPREIVLSAAANNEAQRIAASAGTAVKDLADGKMTRPTASTAMNEQLFKGQQEALLGGTPGSGTSLKDPTRVGFAGFINKLTEMASNPKLLTDKLQIQWGEADKAMDGRLIPALQWQAIKALQYLIKEAPKPLTPPNPLNPKPHTPNDGDLHKYKRKFDAAINPYIILDKLRDGSLTQDEMVTVATVYPNQLQLMRTSVLDALSVNQKVIPYTARMKLSLFLGHPLEPSLEPQFIQSMQMGFAQENAAASASNPQKFDSKIAERAKLGRMNQA